MLYRSGGRRGVEARMGTEGGKQNGGHNDKAKKYRILRKIGSKRMWQQTRVTIIIIIIIHALSNLKCLVIFIIIIQNE